MDAFYDCDWVGKWITYKTNERSYRTDGEIGYVVDVAFSDSPTLLIWSSQKEVDNGKSKQEK